VLAQARDLVARCREQSSEAGTLDAFLKEFGLSNPEGVALMCLAEALLRVPDGDTADRLIAEKINSGDWASHLGRSDSLFVNGSVWGLMLTGRLVTLDPEASGDTAGWMTRLVSRLGEPVVRTAVMQAMRILGRQYVLGRTIKEALDRSDEFRDRRRPGATVFSFDMLGEGARTWADARRHLAAYQTAIETIGATAEGDTPTSRDGISVKLSALHPRFEFARREDVRNELLPVLTDLAASARRHALGFSIDAEEAARLDITLDLFESMALNSDLDDWNGLGFVLQAYQKRAPLVAQWLVALGEASERRLMVRLVKGAYWDAEIKLTQEQGLADYPVFTRKANTDLCYEVCAGILLAAQDAIYPQFATHNATTACQVMELAKGRHYEMQRLHGMGELLYQELSREQGGLKAPVRVYAPVGSHRDLLPYLVRRLLENGANSSFVNRFLDNEVPVDDLVQDTLSRVRSQDPVRHPRIPLPVDLYRAAAPSKRRNSAGVDLDHPEEVAALERAVALAATKTWAAGEGLSGEVNEVRSPTDHARVVGTVRAATLEDVDAALSAARATQRAWDELGGERRAVILERAADLIEAGRGGFIHLIGAEAGRTVTDAVAEVREAADFCRYYAEAARESFSVSVSLPGPTGEQNRLSLHGRGTFACISPWNFPLAIFTGQIAAALAAGNCVVAKPAEQTPLTAAACVRVFYEAGVPEEVLQLLPGSGPEIGGALAADGRVDGIAFTGSTETAWRINRRLAERDGPIVPFIAETGGLNVMIADSTALPEQLVDDVVDSAFRSAGQRCSALRVLYLPEDIADRVLAMLGGAMDTLLIGDPGDLATDVGPVIDGEARQQLEAHTARMAAIRPAAARCLLPTACRSGSFFPPQVFEIDTIRMLEREVFGPILHVIRYRMRDLDRILEEVNASGYGLTLGIHSRIENFAEEIFERTRVGNTYVNRNMIGAVVGVQPFGGQGLSGTGPKAGGPHYLQRFAVEKTFTENVTARGGNAELFQLGGQ
jgi:RHH-type proline utilization regulon transcriptional repressor/proline dehydrogenase/delta 1-pyrroline-5-carboxylate dehydrogenase